MGYRRKKRRISPPLGWIGYGLNVIRNYDNGNDDWLAYNGNKNEWAVVYHGIGFGGKVKEETEAVHIIIKGDNINTENSEKVFLIPVPR